MKKMISNVYLLADNVKSEVEKNIKDYYIAKLGCPKSAEDFANVEVEYIDNFYDNGADAIKIAVYAGLDYDEFIALNKDYLDKLAESYDTNAYFKMVEPGVVEAYLMMN